MQKGVFSTAFLNFSGIGEDALAADLITGWTSLRGGCAGSRLDHGCLDHCVVPHAEGPADEKVPAAPWASLLYSLLFRAVWEYGNKAAASTVSTKSIDTQRGWPFDNQTGFLTSKSAFWWWTCACPQPNSMFRTEFEDPTIKVDGHDWIFANGEGVQRATFVSQHSSKPANNQTGTTMITWSLRMCLSTINLDFGQSKRLCTSQTGFSPVRFVFQ